MFLFWELFKRVQNYLNEEQIGFLAEAYLFSADAHETQMRSSGEPYISHPVAVACILADQHMDVEILAAALMHDVVEDTDITLSDIEEIFGKKVAKLVDGVTKLTSLSHMGKARVQAESFRKMILAMTGDVRVILIKLADRLHNMKTLGALRPEKKRRIGRETMEIYAPIANRLGMHALKSQFEDLAFEGIYPLRYRVLKKCVEKAVGHRKRLVEKILQVLKDALAKEGISPENICGRQKRLYSIFRKMRFKGQSLSEILDVYAFRVIAKDIPDCYRMLGIVHGLFKPVPGRFKDYIAIPKANGYQSLHTTLFGPHGVPIEIQIRTIDMHHLAENGIAAHWIYKEQISMSEAEVRTREWLQKLLEMQKRSGDSFEFVENVKIDLFPDEVYIFTPQGDIMELPAGATVLDFAYAVHTDIGNQCAAAKVNRQLVPFNHVLTSGDQVEIIRSSHARPVPSWLNFVVTGKAKTAIRHNLKQQKDHESVNLGRKLLTFALAELGIDWKQVSDACQKNVIKHFEFQNEKDLLQAVGAGEITGTVVAMAVKQLLEEPQLLEEQEHFETVLIIHGDEVGVFQYCRHCWPLPGDQIQGELIKGEAVQVHQATCAVFNKQLAAHRDPHEVLPLKWADQMKGVFPVSLQLIIANKPGVLARVLNVFAALEVNIQDLNIEEREDIHASIYMVVEVTHRYHLAQVIRRSRKLPGVMKITLPRGEVTVLPKQV